MKYKATDSRNDRLTTEQLLVGKQISVYYKYYKQTTKFVYTSDFQYLSDYYDFDMSISDVIISDNDNCEKN